MQALLSVKTKHTFSLFGLLVLLLLPALASAAYTTTHALKLAGNQYANCGQTNAFDGATVFGGNITLNISTTGAAQKIIFSRNATNNKQFQVTFNLLFRSFTVQLAGLKTGTFTSWTSGNEVVELNSNRTFEFCYDAPTQTMEMSVDGKTVPVGPPVGIPPTSLASGVSAPLMIGAKSDNNGLLHSTIIQGALFVGACPQMVKYWDAEPRGVPKPWSEVANVSQPIMGWNMGTGDTLPTLLPNAGSTSCTVQGGTLVTTDLPIERVLPPTEWFEYLFLLNSGLEKWQPQRYTGFPSLFKRVDGELWACYARGSGHASLNHHIVMQKSFDDGITWAYGGLRWPGTNSVEEVFAPAADGVGADRNCVIDRLLDTNRITVGWNESDHEPQGTYSDNEGQTWAAQYSQIHTGTLDTTLPGGRYIQACDGNKYLPYRYQNVGETRVTSAVAVTTDASPGSFTHFADTIHSNDPFSGDYTESQIVKTCNGDFMALVRHNDVDDENSMIGEIMKVFSTDMQHWSVPEVAFPGVGKPETLVLKNCTIVVTTRGSGHHRPIITTSLDNGQTFSAPAEFGEAGAGKHVYSSMIERYPNEVWMIYGQERTENIGTTRLLFVRFHKDLFKKNTGMCLLGEEP